MLTPALRSLGLPFVGLLFLLAVPVRTLAGQTRSGDERAVLAAFEGWWKRYESGQVLLYPSPGNASAAAQSRSNREEVDRLFEALVGQVDPRLASAALTKPALHWVDPTVNLGQTAMTAQPWWVRAKAREALAKLPWPEVEDWAKKQMRRGNRLVASSPRVAAAEVLSLVGGEKVRGHLLDAFASAAREEQVEILGYLADGLPGDLEATRLVLAATRDGEPNVRVAAIDALGRLAVPGTSEEAPPQGAFPAELRTELLDKLGHALANDSVWQVRHSAARTLARLRHRDAIPRLITGLEAEASRRGSDRRTQVWHAAHESLMDLTGKDISIDRPDWWRDWWEKEGRQAKLITKEELRRREKAKDDRGYLKYFNIDIKSDRLLFIVDRSGSMNEPAKVVDRYGRLLSETKTKFQWVQEELTKLIQSLPEDTEVNVVFFSTNVDVWRATRSGEPKLMPMTTRNKADVTRFVNEIQAEGSTNLYGALDAALQLAGRGLYDRYYKTAFDTIYVLTDGVPTSGLTTVPAEILGHVRDTNRVRQVRIHTITFGSANDLSFMRRLAEENGGEHVHRD